MTESTLNFKIREGGVPPPFDISDPKTDPDPTFEERGGYPPPFFEKVDPGSVSGSKMSKNGKKGGSESLSRPGRP